MSKSRGSKEQSQEGEPTAEDLAPENAEWFWECETYRESANQTVKDLEGRCGTPVPLTELCSKLLEEACRLHEVASLPMEPLRCMQIPDHLLRVEVLLHESMKAYSRAAGEKSGVPASVKGWEEYAGCACEVVLRYARRVLFELGRNILGRPATGVTKPQQLYVLAWRELCGRPDDLSRPLRIWMPIEEVQNADWRDPFRAKLKRPSDMAVAHLKDALQKSGPAGDPDSARRTQAADPVEPKRSTVITLLVATQRYAVSGRTLRRRVKQGDIDDLRPIDSRGNSPLLLDEDQVQARYPLRGHSVDRSGQGADNRSS